MTGKKTVIEANASSRVWRIRFETYINKIQAALFEVTGDTGSVVYSATEF